MKGRMILFVSGISGSGKTTLGENLKKKKGYIHFDGDVFAHSNSRDATEFSGIPTSEMLNHCSDQRKREYDQCVTHGFGQILQGNQVAIDAWLPYLDTFCQGIEEAARRYPYKTIVVTWSAYTRSVRDYIRAKIPSVQFIVLDADPVVVRERKVHQVVTAARDAGQTLTEFLAKFSEAGAPEVTEHDLQQRVGGNHIGFEPGNAETDVCIRVGEKSADQVCQEVVNKLGLL